MKTFVTLFEKAENIHLIKDVGQIPYLMYHYFGYDSMLVTYKNKNAYDYLDNEVKGLKLEFIPKVKFGRYSLSMLWYLYLNAKKIDVLHMFHHREKTYLNFLMYKWRNPNGIAFLKSDTGLNSIKKNDGFVPKRRPKYAVRNWLFQKVLPKLDVISVESLESFEIVSNKYENHKEKFLYMPNGINVEKMYSMTPLKSFEEKENIILTVGRIGAPEKNNELLLSAVENLDLKDWKVVLVGPIEEDFKRKIEQFYEKNPHLKDKVIFTGAIYDRAKLYEWYARSKVFCLTSINEGFPLVFPESLAYGDYIITTDVSGATDITDNNRLGKIISQYDLQNFINALQNVIDKPIFSKEIYNEMTHYARENFNWKNILYQLQSFK